MIFTFYLLQWPMQMQNKLDGGYTEKRGDELNCGNPCENSKFTSLQNIFALQPSLLKNETVQKNKSNMEPCSWG